MNRTHEIALPAEVWSPLVSYTPPYILDANGIVQHEPLAKLLREKGFDTDRRIECEPWGSGAGVPAGGGQMTVAAHRGTIQCSESREPRRGMR